MTRARAVAALLAVLLAGGCAQTKVPLDHFYRLAPPAAGPFPGEPLPGTLVVRPFIADGIVRERAIVHSEAADAHELRQYRYRLWADPPPRMLQEVTVDALRSAGVAGRVVGPEMRTGADWVLVGKLKRLEHVRADPPRAVVRLEFGIAASGSGDVRWLGDYAVEHPARDATVGAAVRAMEAALSKVYARLLADLARR